MQSGFPIFPKTMVMLFSISLLIFHANIMSHNRMQSLSVFSYQIFDHVLEIKFSCVMIFKRLDPFEL